uniref:olfactory receptor 7A17-like n=1 Tax=Odobenus rosmarus divergens TaxID=9708 RepID=UPI00063CCB8E|nr:PREDICTED: olfactory receptor 7A17-like [Odobenus rosmarus divergens]
MEADNDTGISEFPLLGLSEELELQPIIFGLFLCMYLITVLGNLLIILAVSSDSHLHTPMYFFLANLSFVDICFTSTTIPKMLWLCGLLVLVSWVISVLNSLLQSLMVLRLSFCTEVEIPYFFCELNQVVGQACSDTFLNNMVMNFGIVLLAGGLLTGIFYSYSKIVSSILGISSAQGKFKAFSTCASHLSVVSLFYCTVLGVYLSSAAPQSSHSSAVASVMYTVVTPMLNPFIYSLRNRDIKRALKRITGVLVM